LLAFIFLGGLEAYLMKVDFLTFGKFIRLPEVTTS